MPWWPKRGGQAGSEESATDRGDGAVRVELPSPRSPEPTEALVETVDMTRLAAALDRLEIRYLTDGDGSLLAMWERHAVLFTLEGPDDEILVIRARTVTSSPGWATMMGVTWLKSLWRRGKSSSRSPMVSTPRRLSRPWYCLPTPSIAVTGWSRGWVATTRPAGR